MNRDLEKEEQRAWMSKFLGPRFKICMMISFNYCLLIIIKVVFGLCDLYFYDDIKLVLFIMILNS